MTQREALCHAIEVLRTRPTCREDLTAANALERRAERLRARQEAPAMWPHRCPCGERRRKKVRLCEDCNRAVPIALWIAFHTGKKRESARAWRQIVTIAETRSFSEEAAA